MMRRLLAAIAAFALAIALPARADTPIALQTSWAGNVNFTGTEATMRNSATDFCSVVKKNQTLTKPLATIPSGATVLAAYLYWAGSGSSPDYTVTFEGRQISATRKYTGTYNNSGTITSYFAGVADVTSVVKSKGNGTYSFGGLTVNNGGVYCSAQGVLGGFSLLVVYSDPTQPFRVMNLYEGFQSTRYSSLTLNLSNFQVPSPLTASVTGRIGHITWEGDQSLTAQGENLSFNGTALTDAMNPAGNQFNSQSNIDGDSASYGIDFDAYTIGSPIIKAGDTTATTTYSSGQDLVWLNAEIVAVPNVPTVDLALTMTRTGTPTPGAIVGYSLVVTNNGPNSETGPVTVSNTLPAGMTYSTVSGTGWSCSFTLGSATATCSTAGPVAKGAVLPAISISAKVDTSGLYTSFTNTASVAGVVFDNVQTNNSASDTSSDNSTKANGWVFTNARCVPGYQVGTASSQCTVYTGPYTAASTTLGLYITYVSSGVATVPSNNKNKDVAASMQFSLTCVNPSTDQGVSASFAGKTLPLCSVGGWSAAASILFPAGEASGRMLDGSVPPFIYNDVGIVRLNLSDGTNTASVQFTSVPQKVVFTSVVNSSGGVNTGASSSFFARAGETFTANIQVQMADGNYARNFGHESGTYGPVGVAVGQPSNIAVGTVTTALGAFANGVWPVSVTYDDLGTVTLTATIAGNDNTYGAGTYFGNPVTTTTQVVGNFYPGYFETTTDSNLPCMARMLCPTTDLPTGEKAAIDKAAYSRGPFTGAVKLRSMKGTDLTANIGKISSFPSISLKLASGPGRDSSVLSAVPVSPSSLSSTALSSTISATLPNPYQTLTPHPATITWDAPLSAYLRAEATFARLGASGGDVVSSNRGTSQVSVEGGVRLVQGRLMVSNGNGSELLKLPLNIYAQYWTGSSWDNNVNDGASSVGASATYSNCQKMLLSGAACKNVLSLSGGGLLNGGHGTLWLAAPGSGNYGSAQVTVTGAPAWLPVTVGQATFGVYRSPLIYIREVY